MKISDLIPPPPHYKPFRRDKEKFIPKEAGCYVLTTFEDVVLYIGLTENLQRRFAQHLDDPQKIKPTENGKASKFYWVEEKNNFHKIERSWLNRHEELEGVLPILNKIKSPVSV